MLPEPSAELALDHGLFSTAQARRAGVEHAEITRRLRRGRWVRVRRGVLRDLNHEMTESDVLLLAFLEAGPKAVVGLRSAALLLGFDVLDTPSRPEILVPDLPQRRVPGLVRAEVGKGDVVVIGLLRVTTAERTLIDCAARLPQTEAVVMLDSAYRLGLVSPEALRRTWRQRSRLRGHARAGDVLDLADPLSGSAPETEFRLLVHNGGLPPPVTQYHLVIDGHFIGRADFAWPEFRLIVEIDGYEFHSGPAVFQSDRTRGNDLLAADWDVLHFTTEDIRLRPDDTLARVRQRLAGVMG
ncbi:MAG: hypothetical protein QOJ32_1156 [Frankiaceae bacterium]|nr:hypothetical protein [Frankiaceae bacterium]